MTSRGSRLRVVLVDDVDDLRLLLRSLFETYSDVEVVGEATDGEEAIVVIEATQPDLVVLDLSMPVMDGVTALPSIRRVAPAARVVVLSAIPPEADPGAIAAGAVAYVQKGAGKTQRLVPDLLAAAGLLETTIATLQPRSHRTDLPASPESAGMARRFAREVLGDDMSEVLDTVQLLVSELVTNAVVHAASAPPSRSISSTTTSTSRCSTIEVVSQPGRTLTGTRSPGGVWCSWTRSPNVGAPIAVDQGKIVWFDVGRTRLPTYRSSAPEVVLGVGTAHREVDAGMFGDCAITCSRNICTDGSRRRSCDQARPSSRVAPASRSRMTRTAPVGLSCPSRGGTTATPRPAATKPRTTCRSSQTNATRGSKPAAAQTSSVR